MTTITVFLKEGERSFTDEDDRLFDYSVNDGHLRVTEACRRIPGKADGLFKNHRPLHVFPPGEWIEVEVEYK